MGVDKRSGCPAAWAANKDLIKQDFTVSQPSVVDVTGHMIRRAAGRSDLKLLVDGGAKDTSLSYTSSTQWEDVQLHWVGKLNKGKHTVSLRGNKANMWGCGTAWGDIDVLVLPVALKPPPPVAAVYQTSDKRGGCPGAWPANKDLIAKTFKVDMPSVVVLTGHSIRRSA